MQCHTTWSPQHDKDPSIIPLSCFSPLPSSDSGFPTSFFLSSSHLLIHFFTYLSMGQVAQLVQRLTTGWTVLDRIPVRMRFSARPDLPWGPPSLLYNAYLVFPRDKVRLGRAADHSPPSRAAVMEQQSYTSTRPLGHTGPVTGSLYIFIYLSIYLSTHSSIYFYLIIYSSCHSFIKSFISPLLTLTYRVSIKYFPDYKHLLQENYYTWNTNIFFF